jgi:predicted protein tyrosine phosphatase
LWHDLRGLAVEIARLFGQLRAQGLRLTLLAGIDKFGRKLLGRPIWRFSWITPDILLGGQPARRLWRTLHMHGVTGVINLREEYDYFDEMGEAAGLFRYLYLPTRDNTAPTMEHLAEGVAFMQEVLARGGKLYIHCWEGLGRGPTMVAAHLVSQGYTPDEAWATIHRVRPFVRPMPEQRARLVEFAEALAESRATARP